MDKVLTANFDRVEKALTTLVNSIANYTANPLAAVELVKADSELVDGLKLCTFLLSPISSLSLQYFVPMYFRIILILLLFFILLSRNGRAMG